MIKDNSYLSDRSSAIKKIIFNKRWLWGLGIILAWIFADFKFSEFTKAIKKFLLTDISLLWILIAIATIFLIIFFHLDHKYWKRSSQSKLYSDSLIKNHNLYIIKALFGIDEIKTTDVTQQVISRLATEGNVFVHINPLVGGRVNDPVKNDPKMIYVEYYHNSNLENKTFNEGSTFSISDLIA